MDFLSFEKAQKALRRNGFALYAEDKKAQEFIVSPAPPSTEGPTQMAQSIHRADFGAEFYFCNYEFQ